MSTQPQMKKLLDVMTRLRDPNGGCPWDLEQTIQSIVPYTIEETYELVEAVEQNDTHAIKDELGDLLFQVVFLAQVAKDTGLFDFEDVAGHVADKMIERHPHVFGDRDANTAAKVLTNWENDKAAKRQAKAGDKPLSALDGVSTALPAATRAIKLQKRAARVGFDWAEAKDILAKIREEADELQVEMDRNDTDAIEDEMGDLFFAIANLARRLDVDPEKALRRTNRKFERRFRAMEDALLANGTSAKDASLQEMENLWNEIKRVEKKERKAV